MKKLWLTYAWKDNEDNDIDFIIRELDKVNSIETRFDRRNLIPGQRLWQQIGGLITDPAECDAWGIVLTKNSIKSEPCIEELSYALERALDAKGGGFPVFALLHNISASDLPPALNVRLCIPLENNDFVSQVIAAVEKRAPGYVPKDVGDWSLKEHYDSNTGLNVLELRPRFDRISPFAICVDFAEKQSGNVVKAEFGPADIVPNGHVAFSWIDSETTLTDGTHAWVWGANNEINSTTSIFLFYKTKPKRIWFGHQQKMNLIQL
jgi:hypothetical protein